MCRCYWLKHGLGERGGSGDVEIINDNEFALGLWLGGRLSVLFDILFGEIWINNIDDTLEVVVEPVELMLDGFAEHADGFGIGSGDFSDHEFGVCADTFGEVVGEHFKVFIFESLCEVPEEDGVALAIFAIFLFSRIGIDDFVFVFVGIDVCEELEAVVSDISCFGISFKASDDVTEFNHLCAPWMWIKPRALRRG